MSTQQEIHLLHDEKKPENTKVRLNGKGDELMALLILGFTEEPRFFEITEEAVKVYKNHKATIDSMKKTIRSHFN